MINQDGKQVPLNNQQIVQIMQQQELVQHLPKYYKKKMKQLTKCKANRK